MWSIFDKNRLNLKKRIHFVWFVDTEQTHTFSMPLRVFLFGVALLIVTGLGLVASVRINLTQGSIIKRNENYIKELKGVIVDNMLEKSDVTAAAAVAGSHQTPELETAGSAQSQSAAAQSIAPVAQDEKSPRALASASASALAPASASQRSAMRPPETKRTATQESPVQQVSQTQKTPKNDGPVMTFGGFSLSERGEGKTALAFTLAASPAAAGKTVSGRVCIVVTLSDESDSNHPYLTIPAQLLLDEAREEPIPKTCPRGMPVRFARLRPTEIVVDAEISQIAGVGLHFFESTSGQRESAYFEPQPETSPTD